MKIIIIIINFIIIVTIIIIIITVTTTFGTVYVEKIAIIEVTTSKLWLEHLWKYKPD